MSNIDIIAWINTVIRDPETGKPFVLLPAEIAFLDHAFRLDEEGRAIYPELVYSAPKKSGKTGFAAILTLVATLLFGGRDPEAICAANDLEQSASRVFSAVKKIIRASPALRDRAKITNTVITFPETGATITAIASDAAGAAGANPVISVGDELWGFTSEASRRLWDELVPPPTRKASWRFVCTYAGFSGESNLLEDLYKHGTSQPQVAPDLYAGVGQLTFWTHSPVAPWQDEKWLAQMRRSLRPNQYLRLIENRWTTSESAFIDLKEWDACTDASMQPIDSDRNITAFIGVDASLKRDSTAIVAVATDGERVRLLCHHVFQPTPDAPLDFEATIEATIIALCAKFNVSEIRYDPWQMAAVAQRLTRLGAPMVEWPQTTSNLTDASSNLYELIKGRNIVAYPDDVTRLSISQAIAVETPRGWRIAKEKAKHKIDFVVALGMACHAAIKQKPMAGFGIFEFYRMQSEAAVAAQAAPPTLQAEHGREAVMQLGSKRPADHVMVRIPNDSTTIMGVNGASYAVEVIDGERFCWMSTDDARTLCSQFNPPFWEANADLRSRLGATPPQPRGIRVVDYLDHVESMRPRSLFDRGGPINDTLRSMGKL
jgi:hypothetical protein